MPIAVKQQESFLVDTAAAGPVDGNQGRKAVRAGDTAEAFIYQMFRQRYSVERQVEIGHNIYGYPIRCDFVVRRLPGLADGLIIESKWQSAGGSVDEKYPFLVANIRRCYPHPTIILADGGGAKPGAIKWLKTQVDGHKLIGVFSLNELLNWIIDRGI